MRQDALHRRHTPSTRARRADDGRACALANVLRVSGVPKKQLDDWIASGLIAIRLSRTSNGDVELVIRDATRLRGLCGAPGAVPLRRLLDRVRAWLPTSLDPTRAMILIVRGDALLIRAPDGAPVDPFTQFRCPTADPIVAFAPTSCSAPGDWHEHGVAHEIAGDRPAAIECYRRALRLGGPDAQVSFDLAHALAGQGDIDRAIERYEQVVEIDPLRADAWLNLGDLLLERGETEAAIDALRHAIDVDPNDEGAHYALADALDQSGHPQPAALHFKAFLAVADGHDEQMAYAASRVAEIEGGGAKTAPPPSLRIAPAFVD